MFLDHYLENVHGKFAFKCQFDSCKLFIFLKFGFIKRVDKGWITIVKD